MYAFYFILNRVLTDNTNNYIYKTKKLDEQKALFLFFFFFFLLIPGMYNIIKNW